MYSACEEDKNRYFDCLAFLERGDDVIYSLLFVLTFDDMTGLVY